MPRLPRSTLAALIVLALSHAPPAFGYDSGFWSLQLENDYLADFSDNLYTHGFEISYAKLQAPAPWLLRLAELIPFYEHGNIQTVTHSLGQKIFTPSDISVADLIPDDRPYAGWLYVAFAFSNQQEIEPDLYYLTTLELNLGLVGPSSGAESVQNFIHDLINAEQAQGWSHQLNDEPIVGINSVHKWRLFTTVGSDFEFEISPHAVMSLGNAFTYVGGGVMFRWGRGLRNDIGTPSIRPSFPGSAYLNRQTIRNWYLFAGYESRLVLRNIFLDGNSLSDSHSVSKEPIVGDIQLGFAFHLGDMRLSFSETLRSREFSTQSGLNPYSAINLTFYY
ncbi:MAG: lipid A deacylase LpxR family protein [Gammaproteobacteria bacterium]|nr:lipid A deacylase LpxR family protein [Gammaproteobacteria bacterium]